MIIGNIWAQTPPLQTYLKNITYLSILANIEELKKKLGDSSWIVSYKWFDFC